jgi:hypothetical protein
MQIFENIYTISENKGDLTIHRWVFQEVYEDNTLLYHNEAEDVITLVEYYENEDDFFTKNDIFEDPTEALFFMLGIEFSEEKEPADLEQSFRRVFGFDEDDEN